MNGFLRGRQTEVEAVPIHWFAMSENGFGQASTAYEEAIAVVLKPDCSKSMWSFRMREAAINFFRRLLAALRPRTAFT